MIRRRAERALAALVLAWAASPASAADELANDYPTAARADYVFGCMAANGQTRDALLHCSCSIDVIATIIPYDRYEQMETILSMRQGVGMQANTFRNMKMFDDMVAELRRAQAEAEIRCFRPSQRGDSVQK